MKHRLLVSAAIVLAFTLPAQAQLFGPSDEELARQQAHEDGQDAAIRQNATDLQHATEQQQQQLRDLNDRVRSLTDGLARATGANEELGHQISLLNAKIDQQQKDFAYRLCTISAQQLGADAQSLNCAAGGAGAAAAGQAPQAQIAPGARLAPLSSAPGDAGNNFRPGDFADEPTPQRGRAPGVLGTLPASGAPPRPASAPGDNEAGAGGDGRQFDSAMNLLARAQYPEAAAAFRAYADNHPDDDQLSPQALYWVGNIAYMQQDYSGAARAFAEDLKKYPKSPRAGDAMLKMGQALVAQGQTSNGCTAFRAVTKKQYPDASPSTIDAALAARKTSNCR
jgi:tol-pal system protein YbgF